MVSENTKKALVIGFAILLGLSILLVVASMGNLNYGPTQGRIVVFTLISIGFAIALAKARRIIPSPPGNNSEPIGPIGGLIEDPPYYQPDPTNNKNSWTFEVHPTDEKGKPLPTIWIRMVGKDIIPRPPEANDIVEEVRDPKWDRGARRFNAYAIKVANKGNHDDQFWITIKN